MSTTKPVTQDRPSARAPRSLLYTLGGLAFLLLVAGVASAFAVTAAETVDDDNDGLIDHIKVTTDANVDDTTLAIAGWTVTGYPVTGIATTLTSGGANDAVFYLTVTEQGTLGNDGNPATGQGDTGATPAVVYTDSAGTIADSSANQLADHSGAATDSAPPVIIYAQTNPGTKTVMIETSEVATGTGTGGKLRIQDFTAGGGASISSVTHTAGQLTATVTLAGPVASGDIDSDTLALTTSVKDQATVPVAADGTTRAFTDVDVPTISKIETVDADGDGWLDGLKVTFSEYIDDPATFDLTQWTLSSPYGDASSYPTSIATGTADDDVITLVFAEETTANPTGDTAATPTTTYAVGGGTALDDHSDNVLADSGAVASVDKAAPILMTVKTADNDADGIVDRILVKASEIIDQTTATTASEWSVVGYTVSAVDTATGADDDDLVITLVEGALPDSDATPSVAYTPAATVKDKATTPNSLATVTKTATDGAAPIIVNFFTKVGTKTATITFSEGVDNGVGGDLTTSHFTYTDTGGSRTLSAISHTAGESTAAATFSTNFAAADVADATADTIAASGADTIFDTADTAMGTATTKLTEGVATIVKMETLDQDGDGLLDGVRVTFSEALDDPVGFAREQWRLTPGSAQYGTEFVSSSGNYNPTAVTTGSTADDNMITLTFPEITNAAGDTSGTVNVQYVPAGDGAATPLKDSEGVDVGALAATSTTDDAAPVILSAQTADDDGDGLIDRYKVTLSEPVPDSSFAAADWKVAGAAITALDTTSSTYTAVDNVADDAVLVISFPEDSSRKTGSTPDLTYTVGSLKDKATVPNLMTAVAAGDIAETDGAPPVLLTATGEVGASTATLTFSEGVYGTGSGLSLSHTQLDYTDISVDGTARTLTATSHTAGSATVTATFSKVWAGTNDLGLDTIRVGTVDVQDGQTNLMPLPATAVLVTSGSSSDVTPPNGVTDLAATSSATTSTTVKLTWTAPGDDAATGTVSSYLIKYSTSSITSANFAAATTATATFSPNLAAPGATQTATVTGLSSDTTYYFAVKAQDEVPNAGAISNVVSEKTEAADTTAPAAITNLAVISGSTTANSVQLGWTAPGDDGATGTVTSYEIRYATSTITADDFASAMLATPTFDPVTLGTTDTTQKATITGLEQNTMYYFAVKASDEVPNVGAISNVASTTTSADTTAPTGTLAVTSSTHPTSAGVADDSPSFTWTGLTDDESTITYYYAFNQEESYPIDKATDDSTTEASIVFPSTPAGTWYLHVLGSSAGGDAVQVDREITILEGTTPPGSTTDLASSNQDLQDSVETMEVDGGIQVSWDTGLVPDDAAGVSVWRINSPAVWVDDVLPGDSAFVIGKYVDADGDEDSKYIVTAFTGMTQEGGYSSTSLNGVPGYAGLSESQVEDQASQSVAEATEESWYGKWWVWVLIAVGILVLVGLIVLGIVMSRRGEQEEDEWDSEDDLGWVDESEEGDDWGALDDTASEEEVHVEGEAHHMECPECNTHFSATGSKPLVTTCPGCGKSGVLR